MWEPRRLTTLWAFKACYRDSFTFFTFFIIMIIIVIIIIIELLITQDGGDDVTYFTSLLWATGWMGKASIPYTRTFWYALE
jgi:hypothetical protein